MVGYRGGLRSKNLPGEPCCISQTFHYLSTLPSFLPLCFPLLQLPKHLCTGPNLTNRPTRREISRYNIYNQFAQSRIYSGQMGIFNLPCLVSWKVNISSTEGVRWLWNFKLDATSSCISLMRVSTVIQISRKLLEFHPPAEGVYMRLEKSNIDEVSKYHVLMMNLNYYLK